MVAAHEPTIEQYVHKGKPYLHVCDWPQGCKAYAYAEFMRTTPSQERIYRCLNHIPKPQSTYAKAFQYGIPDVRARYPGVHFESFTIRHPSGATIEARDRDSVFTYGAFTYISKNPVEISTSDLLKKFELEDWDWHIVVPGVLDEPPKGRFESGDPKLYTHCQACGEPIEPMKAAWRYGQYHMGKCYDTLFAHCLSCGRHCMDAQTNRSPHAHLWAKHAAQLCDDCKDARWKDRDFRAFADALW